jgi:seryl-tRNA(Sec) selenium transferase
MKQTLIKLKNLVERQTDKNRRRPLKTAKEVLMLIDGCLENYNDFDKYGDMVDCFLVVDDKNKVVKIKVKK